jgi:serine/threonine-protein kinase
VTSILDRATTGFPPDLLNRIATRFQALAWLYAFTFFMAAFFPSLLIPAQRGFLFSELGNWLPGTVSIGTAISVAVLVRRGRLGPGAVTVLALVFEVVSSFGIAAAEFVHPRALMADSSWVGLSWVSVWVLLFNVVVPTVPRYAVIAALASAMSVPAMVLLSLSTFTPPLPVTGPMIFWAFGFRYILVVVMAYAGAKVVHALGTEVTRARELGSYRLEHRLGQGGMGEVWKASHRLLARPAAIKLIRSSENVAGGGSSAKRRSLRSCDRHIPSPFSTSALPTRARSTT